jgi:uncharacterized protein YndB with AHSA1/START domain
VADRLCTLRLTRRYDASPADVWRALTGRESLTRWLGEPNALELWKGGTVGVSLPNGSRATGRIRELQAGRLLELDWRLDGEEPSIVRWELASESGGTVLVVEHSRIDERLGMSYVARWTSALARLPELAAR